MSNAIFRVVALGAVAKIVESYVQVDAIIVTNFLPRRARADERQRDQLMNWNARVGNTARWSFKFDPKIATGEAGRQNAAREAAERRSFRCLAARIIDQTI
jgi:hypothetical protein